MIVDLTQLMFFKLEKGIQSPILIKNRENTEFKMKIVKIISHNFKGNNFISHKMMCLGLIDQVHYFQNKKKDELLLLPSKIKNV